MQHDSACSVLYFRLWPVWLDHIFAHYRTKGTIFGKKNTEPKMFGVQVTVQRDKIL